MHVCICITLMPVFCLKYIFIHFASGYANDRFGNNEFGFLTYNLNVYLTNNVIVHLSLWMTLDICMQCYHLHCIDWHLMWVLSINAVLQYFCHHCCMTTFTFSLIIKIPTVLCSFVIIVKPVVSHNDLKLHLKLVDVSTTAILFFTIGRQKRQKLQLAFSVSYAYFTVLNWLWILCVDFCAFSSYVFDVFFSSIDTHKRPFGSQALTRFAEWA